ncbi:hypothetical protein AMR72_15275 [Flavobacterium psychrophilum]|nr:hypothetical protein AMR72_15275 [Flavobacterium psychrophilum]AOE53755.1 hypothetical protein ALW18_15265 [Flavobacterium psychrophilum]
MRPINIKDLAISFDEIKGKGAFENWEKEAEKHLAKLKAMSHSARKTYLNRNNHWSKLYPALSKLSHGKCWYSESPANSSEWEIEHYRPKLKSKAENGDILRTDGYWWLSYHWKNFRLAGTLVNKIRRDRFQIDGKPYGKGNFFPIDLTADGCVVASPYDDHCGCETTYLLDPINPRDTKYIGFDSNGDAIENANELEDSFNFKRAKLSIYFYGLNHKPVVIARRQIWETCKNEIELAHNYWKNTHIPQKQREIYIDQCYERIFLMSRGDKPYSSVVHSYVRHKKKEYTWLEDLLEVISR